LLTDDSQIGAKLRVCADEEDRADFAEITRKRIRRGSFKSVAELKAAIMEYLDNHNADPKLFIWIKTASLILEKVARAKQALESLH